MRLLRLIWPEDNTYIVELESLCRIHATNLVHATRVVGPRAFLWNVGRKTS
jgi:hypothetical protein